MSSVFEERFNPPFGSYKHQLGYYVVRPLDWCIIGKVDETTGETIIGACNSMLRVDTKEEADMLANVFNKYFDLLKEVELIKKYLKDEINISNRDIARCEMKVKELSVRGGGKTYLANEIMKSATAIRCFECTLDKIAEIEKEVNEKYENK